MTILFGSDWAGSPNSTGTQSFLDTVFGVAVPDAAIFWANMGRNDGEIRAPSRMSHGFAANDGSTTHRWFTAWSNENNISSAQTWQSYSRSGLDAEVFLRPDHGETDDVRSEADWETWDTAGVSVNWGVADPQSAVRKAGTVMISDSHVDAEFYVGKFTPSSSVGGSTTVTDPGWRADVVFTGTVFTANDDDDIEGIQASWGVWARDENPDADARGDTQGCVGWSVADNTLNTECELYLSQDYSNVALLGGSVGMQLEYEADDSGFKVTTRNAGATPAGDVGYLAIKWGTRVEQKVGTYDVPTSTGSDATTVGWQPKYVLGWNSHATSAESRLGGAAASSLGFGWSDGTDQLSFSCRADDDASTTRSDDIRSTHFHDTIPDGSDTLDVRGDLTMNSTGFDIDWTDAGLSTAGFGLYYAVREVTYLDEDSDPVQQASDLSDAVGSVSVDATAIQQPTDLGDAVGSVAVGSVSKVRSLTDLASAGASPSVDAASVQQPTDVSDATPSLGADADAVEQPTSLSDATGWPTADADPLQQPSSLTDPTGTILVDGSGVLQVTWISSPGVSGDATSSGTKIRSLTTISDASVLNVYGVPDAVQSRTFLPAAVGHQVLFSSVDAIQQATFLSEPTSSSGTGVHTVDASPVRSRTRLTSPTTQAQPGQQRGAGLYETLAAGRGLGQTLAAGPYAGPAETTAARLGWGTTYGTT